jgi:hypothetical protein
MTRGWQYGVQKYQQERRNETRRISERLGDCFHDSVKPLAVVSQWHSNIRSSILRCDHITAGVIKMVNEHMLLEDSDSRLGARQLSGRFKDVLASRADLESRTSSMYLDLPVYTHIQDSQPGVWQHPTSRTSHQIAPPNGSGNQGIPNQRSGTRMFSGPRSDSPERMTLYGGDDPQDYADELKSSPTNKRRSVSQPGFGAPRPNSKRFLASDDPTFSQNQGAGAFEPLIEGQEIQSSSSNRINMTSQRPMERQPSRRIGDRDRYYYNA